MPVTCIEKVESRSGDEQSAQTRWIIQGTTDDAVALAELKSTAPTEHRGLPRKNCSIAETERSDTWIGTADYDNSAPAETGESTFSFDTTGGSQHITQSLATISRTPPAGGTAPDFKGAIGVTRDSVEGVDVTVPAYKFSETHYLDNAVVTAAYKAKLLRLTGRVNNAAFKGLAAGECLFLGAGGSRRDGGDWEITFNFAGSPNRTAIAVGDITVPAKKGWEYLWVRYEDVEDTAAKRIVKRPIAAYVEKVYEEDTFSDLGIGT